MVIGTGSLEFQSNESKSKGVSNGEKLLDGDDLNGTSCPCELSSESKDVLELTSKVLKSVIVVQLEVDLCIVSIHVRRGLAHVVPHLMHSSLSIIRLSLQ